MLSHSLTKYLPETQQPQCPQTNLTFFILYWHRFLKQCEANRTFPTRIVSEKKRRLCHGSAVQLESCSSCVSFEAAWMSSFCARMCVRVRARACPAPRGNDAPAVPSLCLNTHVAFVAPAEWVFLPHPAPPRRVCFVCGQAIHTRTHARARTKPCIHSHTDNRWM